MGRRDALADPAILAKKQAEEDDFRAKVNANPEWKKAYGNAWDEIAGAEEKMKPEIKGTDVPPHRRPDAQHGD